MTLTLAHAQTIAAAALTKGREMGLKPLTVAVIDAGGHVKLILREDGASNMRPEIATGKAHGAIAMGISSRALYDRAQVDPYFIQAMNALAHGSLVPVPGGVLIRHDGNIIGAVGITGDASDNDEACCIAGVKAAGFEPEI